MRVKSPRHARHKKFLELAKGYHGARHRWYRKAKEAVVKAGEYAFAGRKLKKRDLRRTWITRINGALKSHGLKYSAFISALAKNKIMLDRKILSDLAATQPKVFLEIVKSAGLALPKPMAKKGLKVDKIQA